MQFDNMQFDKLPLHVSVHLYQKQLCCAAGRPTTVCLLPGTAAADSDSLCHQGSPFRTNSRTDSEEDPRHAGSCGASSRASCHATVWAHGPSQTQEKGNQPHLR